MKKLFHLYFKSSLILLVLSLFLPLSLFLSSCKSTDSRPSMTLDFSLSKDILQRLQSFAPVSVLNRYLKHLCETNDTSITFNHSKYSSIKFIYSYFTSLDATDTNLSITEFLVDTDKTIEYLSYQSTPTIEFIEKDNGAFTIYKDTKKVAEDNIYTTNKNVFSFKNKIKDIDSLCATYNERIQQLDKITTLMDVPNSQYITKIDDKKYKSSSYLFTIKKENEDIYIDSLISTEGVLKDFGIKSIINHERQDDRSYSEHITLKSYEFK